MATATAYALCIKCNDKATLSVFSRLASVEITLCKACISSLKEAQL